ncbi:MAG: glutamine--fructose-6-phosphate transaminase (isomerizing) [Bacteroidota bacterium]
MCGIIGYIGEKQAEPILIDGLKRLEYRGYDSAGIALIENSKLQVFKKKGKVSELEKVLPENSTSKIGIGHTRWATHGAPNDINAHPHYNRDNTIAVIHNGIIENHNSLKIKLQSSGYIFLSSTDTEVLVHLISEMLKHSANLETAVRLALQQIEGTYGIAVISSNESDKIIAARKGSPLVIGIGENENYLASDASALIKHTRKVIYLEDGEIATITKQKVETKTIDDIAVEKITHQLTIELSEIEKSGYDHFMLKEIMEQPETLRNSMRGRILLDEGDAKLGGIIDVADKFVNAERIIIAACGTSWHAALVGEYLIEQMTRIPVEVEYASEFRYRNPIIKKNDVVILISQSGETADTLAALREARTRGANVFGICNVVGSTIARESDAGIYIHAGPEIGVASTKAFTSQLVVLSLLSLFIARRKGMSLAEGQRFAQALIKIPDKVEEILKNISSIEKISDEYKNTTNALYLGRGANFPVALEGALKLKEISYIHAEGYPAAEMKHGPIALIDANMPVVFVAPKDNTFEKVLSNVQEIKARGGKVISIINNDDDEILKLSNHTVRVPQSHELLNPILSVIPLQILAYFIAIKRGCNVDQPRNLAKSVTVE